MTVQLRRVPDALTMNDGTRVVSISLWEARRKEILEYFLSEEYGRLPDMSEVSVAFRVADARCDFHTMKFQALRKTIEISAERNGIHFAFPLVLFIPEGAGHQVGCFLTICNRGIKDGDPARHFLSPFWPAETIVSRGYAAAVIFTQDIAPDYDEGFTMGFHKLFPELTGANRPDDAWGTISAWSWGAQQVMNYLEVDPHIDKDRVAVVGHSRGGKTALWTAAQDSRFSMVVSSCAGNSGDALSRESKGETVADIVGRFPYWFCKNYRKYAHHEDRLPMDQHMLLSLIAPRLLYTTSKTFDSWADPFGQFESLLHARKAYEQYGLVGIAADVQPPAEVPLLTGEIGYHLKTGYHDLDEYDWDHFLDFADYHWARK